MSDGTIKKIKLPDNKVYDIAPSFSSENKNLVFATPANAAGEPSFRALASSDIPSSLNLTGTPTAPTAASGTNTTQIATTAFVQSAINNIPGLSGDVITFDQVGAPDGVAPLDSGGKISRDYLPSYVDDVIEKESLSNFPSVGETDKIYVAKDTNLIYRWGGSSYVAIGNGGETLALGETSSTAYRGDRGAAAYAHAVTNKGNAFISGLYKITTNSEGHVTAAIAVEKSDIVALGIPEENTTYSNLSATNGTGSTEVSLVTRGEKYTWNNKGNGTVTAITAGTGLNGGEITTNGTISLKLNNTSQMSYSASIASPVADRTYPVRLDSNGNLAVNVPWEDTIVDTSNFITSDDLDAAAYKGVVTSISSSSTDSNVPTAKAVYTYITNNLPTDDDTTNTTGTGNTSNTTSTYYIPGATTQSSTGVQTYSSSKVYFKNGKLYSNSKEVVNLSDSQALTNKTYNGYTLNSACEYGVDTTSSSISSSSSNIPTSAAVAAYVADNGGTDTNYYHSTGSWSGLTYTATANGGAPALSFTVPSASTSAKGAVQLSSSTSSTSSTLAATASAVKAAYDLAAAAAPSNLVIETTNTSASDNLLYGTNTTLTTGQLVFIKLKRATSGSSAMTIRLGTSSTYTKNIYINSNTPLTAAYAANSVLGCVYDGTNLILINPPVAI